MTRNFISDYSSMYSYDEPKRKPKKKEGEFIPNYPRSNEVNKRRGKK